MWRAFVLVVVGCGRLGFDPGEGRQGDGGAGDDDGEVDAGPMVWPELTPMGSGMQLGTASGWRPSIASTGETFGVVWSTDVGELKFVEFSDRGVMINTPRTIGTGVVSSLITIGTGYALLYASDNELRLARLDAAGETTSEQIITSTMGTTFKASLARDASRSELCIAWTDTRTGSDQYFAVDTDLTGVKLTADLQASTANTARSQPWVGCDGDDLRVTWESLAGTTKINYRAFRSGANLVSATELATIGSDPQLSAAVLAGPRISDATVFWRPLGAGGQLRLSSLDPETPGTLNGTPVQAIADLGTLTWTGERYLVAWEGYETGEGYNVNFASFEADFTPTSLSLLVLPASSSTSNKVPVSVARTRSGATAVAYETPDDGIFTNANITFLLP